MNQLKFGDVVQVSKIEHQFFFAFFRVDLIEIIQRVKNGPSSIRSCRTLKIALYRGLNILSRPEGGVYQRENKFSQTGLELRR